MATWIIGGALLIVVALIIRNMVKEKKSGAHACCGDCSQCKGCH